MDNRITREPGRRFILRNKETGQIEGEPIEGRVRAMDTQNHLWARGIKCTVHPELTDEEYAAQRRAG